MSFFCIIGVLGYLSGGFLVIIIYNGGPMAYRIRRRASRKRLFRRKRIVKLKRKGMTKKKYDKGIYVTCN